MKPNEMMNGYALGLREGAIEEARQSEKSLEPLMRLLLAVNEGRVVVLPCKVGDTVYRVSFVHKKVDVLKVDGFLANVASWKVHCTHIIPSWIGNPKEHVYLAFSSFGKTVFLTCKEAEQALKGEKA